MYRFLDLKTIKPLANDNRFYALPDACTYTVFNQRDPKITGVTKLRTASEEFNRGRDFDYVNRRFLPVYGNPDHASPGPSGTQIYFSVEDCKRQETRVTDSDGTVVRSKLSIGEFGFVTLCRDSEGNMIGFNSMN